MRPELNQRNTRIPARVSIFVSPFQKRLTDSPDAASPLSVASVDGRVADSLPRSSKCPDWGDRVRRVDLS